MSYLDFTKNIDKTKIHIIFELGSRDLIDALRLHNYFKCRIFAFECNPDCLTKCDKLISNFDKHLKENITLVKKAVAISNGKINFYPFDLNKYDNMGSSSLFKIDFTRRNVNDPDYGKKNPQKEISVDGTRLDTFMDENNIKTVDLLCIDLQGYELNALKSLGKYLSDVKYIITECSINSTYIGGCSFKELNGFLEENGFKYVTSNKFGDNFPNVKIAGFSEFDSLFEKKF